jgi:choline transport protein
MEKELHEGNTTGDDSNITTQEVLINASGHHQELDRNFYLINIAGLGVTSGNTWMALGGSIVCLSLQEELSELPY